MDTSAPHKADAAITATGEAPALQAGYADLIDAALNELLHGQTARLVTDEATRFALKQLAHNVERLAADRAVRELRSTSDVAAALNVSSRTVQVVAALHDLGWVVTFSATGTPRETLFRPEDVERLRLLLSERKPGRRWVSKALTG